MAVRESGSRNKEKTYASILKATLTALNKYGSAATLQNIADLAGVSKSGLLHHFVNKDELMKKVADDFFSNFRAEVMRNVDLTENRPGKILRAYVRTLCREDQRDLYDYHMFLSICSALTENSQMRERVELDSEEWRTDLSSDGIDSTTVSIVRYAAEGLAAASSFDRYVQRTGMREALPNLLRMTEVK